VFLGGLARDFCVRASAVDAAADGFQAVVLDDLTRAVFPDRRAESDAVFAKAGVRLAASGELAG
jgi:nicotinamidase/pyrazinamidase